MEVAKAVELFWNSVNRGIQYVKYMDDVDSIGFQKEINDMPYGNEITVEKLGICKQVWEQSQEH